LAPAGNETHLFSTRHICIVVVEAQGVGVGSIIARIMNFEVSDAPVYLEEFVRIPLDDVATGHQPTWGQL
jgi:hypothetical protein